MYRYEEIGIRPVGDIGSFLQGYEHIRLTGVHHPDIWLVALHVSSESQRHRQVDVLFLRDGSQGSRVMSSVTSIDNERKTIVGRERIQDQQKPHSHQG